MSEAAQSTNPTQAENDMAAAIPIVKIAEGAKLSMAEYKQLQLDRARTALMCSARNLQLARRTDAAQTLYDFVRANWTQREYNAGLAAANQWLEDCRASGRFKEEGARRNIDALIQLAIAWIRSVRAEREDLADKMQEFGESFWSKAPWSGRVNLQIEHAEAEDV